MFALLFAILAPVFYGLMNVWDKYVIAHRVKEPLGYSVIVGVVNFFFACVIAGIVLWTGGWTGTTWLDALFPAIAGIMLGLQAFVYYLILEKEDVSQIIGYAYLYPVVVAILSSIFLAERLPLLAYLGVAMTIAGVILLSVKSTAMRIKSGLLMIATLIILIALGEFSVKLGTESLGVWQGVAINNAMMGLTLLCALMFPSIRRATRSEAGNIRWALGGEFLTVCAVFSLYSAMTGLPATIVASIGAIQPVIVMGFEYLTDRFLGRIAHQERSWSRVIAILIIVLGVAILSWFST